MRSIRWIAGGVVMALLALLLALAVPLDGQQREAPISSVQERSGVHAPFRSAATS